MANRFIDRIWYNGNLNWDLLKDPEESRTGFGLTVRRYIFSGPPDTKAKFKADHRRGKTIDGFYITDVVDGGERPWPTVELTAKGIPSDEGFPDPLPVLGFAINSASKNTSTPSQATREVTYLGPTVTWQYVSDKQVTVPRKGGIAEATWRQRTSTVTDKDGRVITGSVDADLLTALTFVPSWDLQGIVNNPEPYTPYYNVEETWEVILF